MKQMFLPFPVTLQVRIKTKTINCNMEQYLEPIRSKIYEIRGQRVMLDRDLAELQPREPKPRRRIGFIQEEK